MAGTVQAALITWGPTAGVSATSDVSAAGALVEAFNAGGSTSGTSGARRGALARGTKGGEVWG